MLHRDPAARVVRFLLFVTLSVALPAAAWAQEGELAPMGSEAELTEFLQGLHDAAQAEMSQYSGEFGDEIQEVITTGTRAAPESITNSQHAGVDEGGIVKQHGDHLVILRRGRLFTVDISGPQLKPIAAVNAYAPGLDGDAWYDEMLVSDNSVVVIGYSYGRDSTEIGIFNINSNGFLRHRATYHVRSFDYYSSRNYASRLINGKLILYAPLPLTSRSDDPLDVLPAMRKWTSDDEDEDEGEFKRIITARDIYRPPVSSQLTRSGVLHSMTVCDLARRELHCRATGVIGDEGRVFYVSPKAMHIWVDHPGNDGTAMLVRMPLTGTSPSALRVLGGPIDQFSFDESNGTLNVLVQSAFVGDAMWRAERDAGESLALLSIPVRSFGDGSTSAPELAYRPLPHPGDAGTIHNRFVGKYLVYGTGEGWWEENAVSSKVFAVPVKGGAVRELALPHGVDRIEPIGRHALVVGESEDDLHFTGIRLARTPSLAQRYVMKNAAQGELRSHGFFYKADGRGGGVLGLPVNNPAAPGYEHLFDESAGVAFLRKTSSTFEDLGQLSAHDAAAVDDNCQSSCVDWYGNSRPLFIENRIFALLGYELVEGRTSGGSIREVRRVNFAPRQVTAAR
jgi:hypothetical protein